MQVRLSHQIIAAALFKLLINIGRRFIYPFAPALSRGLEVPLSAITAIIATGQVASLLGLFIGPIADRIGYRFMMRSGLGLLAVGMLLCFFLPFYWAVFVGLVLASFGKILFDPALQAYLGREVPYSKRARAIGVTETSWAGSTLMGIPLLGMVIQYGGIETSFLLLGVLAAFAWYGISKIIPADSGARGERTSIKQIIPALLPLFKNRAALGMMAFGFWISVANDCLFVVYGVWFEHDFNVSLISLGFSTVAIGLAELLGESGTALFSDRVGLKKCVIIGLILATLSYFLLPLVGLNLFMAMAGMFCVFCTFEFTIVTSFSLCTELMPESRATMMAGLYAAAGLGRMMGVLMGTLLWKMGGILGVCWVAAALTFLGLVSVLWGLKGWKPASQRI